MDRIKNIEDINKILVANNALVDKKIDSQDQSYGNLTCESVTDGEDNLSSNNLYKIHTYNSSFDAKIKGVSSVSYYYSKKIKNYYTQNLAVNRDRFMDFEEMSVGEAIPSGKRDNQQQHFHQAYQFILGTPKYRNNSITINSNNGGSKASLISSKKSEISRSDEDTTKIFLQQLKLLQNKVNQQESQMKNMDLKCEEVKNENNELKKNLDKISKENEEKKQSERDQEILKIQAKNINLQEQLEKVKVNYENRISEYQNLIDDLNQQLLDRGCYNKNNINTLKSLFLNQIENQVEETKRSLNVLQKKMNQTKEQNQLLIEKVKNLEDLIEKQVDESRITDENSNSRVANNIKQSQQSSINFLSISGQNSSLKCTSQSNCNQAIPKKHQSSSQKQNPQNTSSYVRNLDMQGEYQNQSQQQQVLYQNQLNSSLNITKYDEQQHSQKPQTFIKLQNLQKQINQQQQLEAQISQQKSQNFNQTQQLQQILKSVLNKQIEEEEGRNSLQKERSKSQQSSRSRSPLEETLKLDILSNNNFSEFNQTNHRLDQDDYFMEDNKFISTLKDKQFNQISNNLSKQQHNNSLKLEDVDSTDIISNNKSHSQQIISNNLLTNSSNMTTTKNNKDNKNSKMMALLIKGQQQKMFLQKQKQQTQNKQNDQRLNETIDQVRCRSEQRNVISPLPNNLTIQSILQNEISPISNKQSNKNHKKGDKKPKQLLNKQNISQTLDNSFISASNQNNSFSQMHSLNSTNNNIPINNNHSGNINSIKSQTNKPPSRSKSRQEEVVQFLQNNNSQLLDQQLLYSSLSNNISNKYNQLKNQQLIGQDLNNQSLNKSINSKIKNDSLSPHQSKNSQFRSIDYEPNTQQASRKQASSSQGHYQIQQKGNINAQIQNSSKSPQHHSNTHKNISSQQAKNQKVNLTLNTNYLSSNSQTPKNTNTNANSTKSKKGTVKSKIQKYQSLNADDCQSSNKSILQNQKYQTITPSSQSSIGCSTAHTNSSISVQQQSQFLQYQIQPQFQQMNQFCNSVDTKLIQNKNKNSNHSDSQKLNQLLHNQRTQNNRSPLQQIKINSNSPQLIFYEGNKQNGLNKTMDYVDVTNYLEGHGLQQQILDENQQLSIKNSNNQNNKSNYQQINNIAGQNAQRQSIQLQNAQYLTNLNSAHLRSRSEQAQYNQIKQQQFKQQQINDQINNSNKNKQLQLLCNDEAQNKLSSSVYDINSKNIVYNPMNNINQKNIVQIKSQLQDPNFNLSFNNHDILEQTITSSTTTSIKSRQKNK